jgi:hypothetical protein
MLTDGGSHMTRWGAIFEDDPARESVRAEPRDAVMI